MALLVYTGKHHCVQAESLVNSLHAGQRILHLAVRVKVADSVIVVKHGDLVLAVDQHAADERIRLEQLQDTLKHAIGMRCRRHSEPLRQPSNPSTVKWRRPIRLVKEANSPTLGAGALLQPVNLDLTFQQSAVLADHQVLACMQCRINNVRHAEA